MVAEPKERERNDHRRRDCDKGEPGDFPFVGKPTALFQTIHLAAVVAGVPPAKPKDPQPTQLPLQFINHIAAAADKTRFCSSRAPLRPCARCHHCAPTLFLSKMPRPLRDSS